MANLSICHTAKPLNADGYSALGDSGLAHEDCDVQVQVHMPMPPMQTHTPFSDKPVLEPGVFASALS